MAEHDKGKEFLMGRFIGSPVPPPPIPPDMIKFPDRDSEEMRFDKMVELNGKTFDNGERSQGDQEAEQRMVQNKTTGLLQKFVNMVTSPFSSALEKEFGTEDQPKYGGQDAVMYKGKFIHPDLYKLLMNRPDLEQRFTDTGSIFGE